MMKTKILLTVIITMAVIKGFSQNNDRDINEDKKVTYYTNRAKEDAKFEQEYKAISKEEEKKFWKEQKAYEKELKKRDKIAYEAYMQGKRDAYAEHHSHCNHYCNHGYYYHNHASFYYGYEHYHHQPRSTTTVRVNLPRIRLGF